MRIAVLSDIHANRQALEAVLATVEEAVPDAIWCLGDIVGYGADPDACTTLMRERCDLCLVGNHDLAVLGALDISTFSEGAAAAVAWTRENISEPSLEFMRGLEPSASQQGIGLFHASPRDPVWEYVLSSEQADAGIEAQEERIGLIGHSHVALFFMRPEGPHAPRAEGAQAGAGAVLPVAEGRWLLNPGSVGQPRDGDPRAAWLELDTEEWTASFHRVGYDIEAAAAAILSAGLPEPLAERLQAGR
ncbi:MAG TPA: metallophosphoesterase family protein [Solirubrobacterales bacterium]|nr:metallophosphoesterase family protein [Solirubrobacterales bacterium]